MVFTVAVNPLQPGQGGNRLMEPALIHGKYANYVSVAAAEAFTIQGLFCAVFKCLDIIEWPLNWTFAQIISAFPLGKTQMFLELGGRRVLEADFFIHKLPKEMQVFQHL